MSAPNINNIILVGGIMAFITVFFVETERETVPLRTMCVVSSCRVLHEEIISGN